ncbi:precorrin-3B synthase [Bartonella choladocola]|uniref:Precorrin-3B synthase n=1 Tax=Bartonella choladocola TaxID=2750995 RepID=A0A1U9MH57_9HYPH|nr:precorrin-3B synthase [Bartonella choladocola]
MMNSPATEIENKIKAVQDRRYACPGLFRMPLANDGGICRIKLPLGCVTSDQLNGLADAVDAFSTGFIELTTRANLQIRAVEKNNEQKLIDKLLKLGLGPLTPEGDDIRNVMVAPTAGIDVDMSCDTTKLGKELLEMLQLEKEFAVLSPKFSFLINGGETTRVLDHIADIWLSALPDGKTYNFGFASSALDNQKQNSNAVGNISACHALEFIRSALEAFIAVARANPSISRMKHLCSGSTFKAFLTDLSNHFGGEISKPVFSINRNNAKSSLAGIFPQKQEGCFYVGARPELGRLTSGALREIAKLGEKRNIATPVRLTHHQGIIISDCSKTEAESVKNELSRIGLATDENSPALYVYCCAGAPFCRSALSDVQRDGKYLVDHLSSSQNASIHLTACPKSCVATVAFPFTLLAVKDGVYNLYRADSGQKTKFGKLLFENAGISDIVRYIEQSKNETQNKKAQVNA